MGLFAHLTGLLDSAGCFLVAVEVGAEVEAGVLAGAVVVADFDCCFLGYLSDSGYFVAVLVALVALVVLVVLVVPVALADADDGDADDAGAVDDAPPCDCERW